MRLLQRSPRFQHWLDNDYDPGEPTDPYWAQQFETDIFAIWLAYCSTNSIESAEELLVIDQRQAACRLRTSLTEKCLQLIKLYLLGDELQDIPFKNHVMDNLVTHLHHEVLIFGGPKNFNRAAHYAYASTTRKPRSHLLRRVITEYIFSCASVMDLDPKNNSCQSCKGRCEHLEQIAIDLAVVGMRMDREQLLGPLKPWEQEKCSYHEHDEQHSNRACQ